MMSLLAMAFSGLVIYANATPTLLLRFVISIIPKLSNLQGTIPTRKPGPNTGLILGGIFGRRFSGKKSKITFEIPAKIPSTIKKGLTENVCKPLILWRERRDSNSRPPA